MALLLGCSAAKITPEEAGPAPAWVSTVTQHGDHQLRIDLTPEADRQILTDLAGQAIDEVERRFAPSGEGSVLAAVNQQAGGDPVRVPDDLRLLVRRALAFGVLTDGAIDPTDGPLRALWSSNATPSPESIRLARDRVDRHAVTAGEFDGTLCLTREGLALDLDSLGRAYALAIAAERLATAGARAYRLEYGETIILGHSGARYWRLPLPPGPGTPPRARRAVRVSGGAVTVISGDPGRTGPILSVIDPRSGSPSRTVSYALVVSSDPVQSAALARALVVLGRTRGMEILEAMDAVEGLVVDTAGYVHASEGLRGHILREPMGGP
jgi:thiamine biosynthesis lipoprotein